MRQEINKSGNHIIIISGIIVVRIAIVVDIAESRRTIHYNQMYTVYFLQFNVFFCLLYYFSK